MNKIVTKSMGGSQIFLYFLAKEFLANGHEVHFISFTESDKEIECVEGATIHHLAPSLNPFLFLSKLFKTMKKIECDLYIRMGGIPWPHIFILPFFPIFTKIISKKYIFLTAHEDDCMKTNLVEKRTHLGILLYLFHLNLSSGVVVQTEKQLNLIYKNFNVKALSVIGIGQPVPNHYTKDETPFAFWNARFVNWKRPELFIRLAKELPKYNFKMGGPISYDNKCYSSLKDEINKIPNLEILPFIADINEFVKYPYYNRASMFIETLKTGGFENTAIQALMRETPIISYEHDFDNLLEREEFGYNCHGSFNEFKKRVEKLFENPKIRMNMGEKGRSYCVEKHNINYIYAKYLDLFNMLVKE